MYDLLLVHGSSNIAHEEFPLSEVEIENENISLYVIDSQHVTGFLKSLNRTLLIENIKALHNENGVFADLASAIYMQDNWIENNGNIGIRANGSWAIHGSLSQAGIAS
jgi:hypothetical protein